LFQQERWLDAAAVYERAIEAGVGGLGVSMQRLAQCYYNAEAWKDAADAYEAMQRFPGHRANALYNAACSAALGGETQRALDLLARAFEAGFSNRELARTDSDLASIRQDARFGDIVGR
jgi:tetratricopeptide (TPR) repeat protein